ncbi:hypothetical protein L1D27_17890 [Vibrio harveyi]|uniref:hypothetical protein n=1 Tax=Vibrio harveyi TaxID=669 RepID=UPI001EFEB75D|nr:hypothetical protein [Vibrio harveyi]MCG9550271.1 hypothetical protein [Vibrio harveyi]
MKAVYTFPITGLVKVQPEEIFPVKAYGAEYTFVYDKDCLVTHVRVSINVQREWYPRLYKRQDGITSIDVSNPVIGFIKRNLKGFESLMSIWSLESIDTSQYEVEWFPENAKEESELVIKKHKVSVDSMPVDEMEHLPFSYIARSVINSWDGADISTATNFYRRGCADIKNGQYIDAIYDFYLILESSYGDGKWRGKDIKLKLKGSSDLRTYYMDIITNIDKYASAPDAVAFKKHHVYGLRSYDKVIDHWVDLRGALHHHSEKNPKAWDPNNPEEYKLDALILFALCNTLIFKKTWQYLDDEKTVAELIKQSSDNFKQFV